MMVVTSHVSVKMERKESIDVAKGRGYLLLIYHSLPIIPVTLLLKQVL